MIYNTVFCPGSYGTYLAWSIYTYSELNITGTVNIPFGPNGSAHLFRTHAGIQQVPTMHDFSCLIGKNVIYIKPNPERQIEYLDNQYAKQSDFNDTEILESLLGKDYKEKIKSIWKTSYPARWEEREQLSFFLKSLFENQIRDFQKTSFNDFNLIEIESADIIENLEIVLMKIFTFFNLAPHTETIKNLCKVHDIYCKLQKNLNKGTVTEEYANCAILGKKFLIDNCTIFDEAWIQHLIRNKGFEIKCYELNQFPTCASKLTYLLEKI